MMLIVDHLFKRFKTKKVLSDVSFKVSPNEIVGLLGPNGAGKSTLMNIISGCLNASSGNVRLQKNNTELNSPGTKKEIGYLQENNPLYIEMYVREYLNFCASLYPSKISEARIDEVAEDCGLLSVMTSKVETLSKGYKQRLGLAQAILHNPSILILDEPTSGLDPSQQLEMRQLIRKLSLEKVIIFSTHILQEVEDLCDRILIINEGRIVKDCQLIGNRIADDASIQEVYQNLTQQ